MVKKGLTGLKICDIMPLAAESLLAGQCQKAVKRGVLCLICPILGF
jgi:hypothetical protein